MEGNEENKVNTEELKNEATNTVNQVKDTIKNVDIKKDSLETKGFITEMFKNPLEKIKEIVDNDNSQYLKYAIIILVIWAAAELIKRCFSYSFSYSSWWSLSTIGNSIWSIIAATIAPIVSILVMSVIVLIMNKQNKKPLTKLITVVTTANIPVVIASVVGILTSIVSSVSTITIPFTSLCNTISIVLMYFTLKSVFKVEKNSDFIKKFVIIEAIYYVAYIVLSLLKIYI